MGYHAPLENHRSHTSKTFFQIPLRTKTSMATNVFGSPITDASVMSSISSGNSTAAHKRRAEWAMGRRFADGKYEKAREAVEKLKEKDGNTTLGLIYNATGDAIKHVSHHDWEGQLASYPEQLENGQWGVFLHVRGHSGGSVGAVSVGAVVYRGTDKSGADFDRMLAWYNPFNQPKLVYTEVRAPRHYETSNWSYIREQMQDSSKNSHETGNGCHTIVKIDQGDDGSAYFEGILTLDGVV